MSNIDHAHLPHHEHHFTGNQMIRDIVIGMSDGLTVPFALAAGLAGTLDNNSIIITAGLAEIAAGSIAMGLGGYLASKSDTDHYQNELKREYEEVERVPLKEEEEVYEVFEEYGITKEQAFSVVEALKKDKTKWVDFMMKFELGLEEPEKGRASKSALTISLSYIVGGIIPLLPYKFSHDSNQGLIYSSICTGIALLVFGLIKGKYLGMPAWKSSLQTFVIGSLAAGAAYILAKLLGGQ